MKKNMIKTVSAALIVLMISLCATGCGNNNSPAGSEDEPNTTEQSIVVNEEQGHVEEIPEYDMDSAVARREFMWKYRDDDKVQQVLLITYYGKNNAVAQFFEKLPEENNAWSLVLESDAFIGLEGVGECNEEVCVTPLGDFEVQKAFGIRKNPGTELEYIDIRETTYACCEDCEYYNQIIDIEETGHECEGEEMFAYSPQYNYGLTIDYNSECVYPNGSNIFIHCKGYNPYTGACIALDEEDMVTILKKAQAGMRVFVSKYY